MLNYKIKLYLIINNYDFRRNMVKILTNFLFVGGFVDKFT